MKEETKKKMVRRVKLKIRFYIVVGRTPAVTAELSHPSR